MAHATVERVWILDTRRTLTDLCRDNGTTHGGVTSGTPKECGASAKTARNTAVTTPALVSPRMAEGLSSPGSLIPQRFAADGAAATNAGWKGRLCRNVAQRGSRIGEDNARARLRVLGRSQRSHPLASWRGEREWQANPPRPTLVLDAPLASWRSTSRRRPSSGTVRDVRHG